jgi:putative intracellular protease/amidase
MTWQDCGDCPDSFIERLRADTPISVAVLAYPGCTLLDLVGPHTVLAALPGAEVHIYGRRAGAITTDSGAVIFADRALDEVPAAPTVLMVPGGAEGTLAQLDDPMTLCWLADVGSRARWVTSVCSGALLLGAAGLLRGYRATSHWAVREALALFGAEPVAERVVADRNRLTGGGVTAGIDFGLTLAAVLSGEDVARSIQLQMEYAPAPPFDAGSPELAGPAITSVVRAGYDVPALQEVLARAAARTDAIAFRRLAPA